jgi:MoaA/NifB/PqqE/SkfB family radical SAM enzyme
MVLHNNIIDTAFPGMPVIARQEFDRCMPSTFAIETSLVCNLKCPECALGGNMIDREKGLLTFERFKIIAEKIRPFAKLIYLHLWGEPMLNPDIFSMIRYATSFASTHISTNALTLDGVSAEELIGSGVSEILVSIDGATQQVYQIYRVGGNLQKALNALKKLQRLNVSHGDKVKIVPQFIVFKHNQHEMKQFEKICGELHLEASFKAPYIRNDHSHLACADDPRYIRPHFPTVSDMRFAMTGCQNPKDVFTILLDGSVVACCHDYKRMTCFGNIFDQDLLEIWNSRKFRQFRWDVLTGNAPKFCLTECMSYFLESPVNKKEADIAPIASKPIPIQFKTAKKEAMESGKKSAKNMEQFHRLDVNDPANRDYFQYLLNHPQEFGLREIKYNGKRAQQKQDLMLGEYFYQLAVRSGKMASDLLFRGQWDYEIPEWFDHRHHFLNPERWFTDFWAASADNIIPLLPLEGKMLNLCSGDGFYDYYFYRKRVSEIICIEMNHEAYRFAKRLHSADNIKYINGNVLTWNPPVSYFDVVVICGAIELFPPADQQTIFKIALKALKPGGWFCGDTPAKKTDGKHISRHEHQWVDETQMRNALGTCFKKVQTGTLKSREIDTLFWRCQKQ